MKVAIINLTGGGFSGGYRKYLKNMLPRLTEHGSMDDLLCIVPEGSDILSWFKEPLAANYRSCSPLTLVHFAHMPDRKMAKCIREFSPDVIFFPVDRFIKVGDVPVVNMVRNMEPFVPNMKGDTFREKFKKLVQRKLTCNSVRMADHTIAVSGFVKDFLIDKMRVPERKVTHVYHGLSSHPGIKGLRPSSIPPGWEGNFLFTCGSIRPARGLEDALEALSHLKDQSLYTRLVIAGETVPGVREYRASLEKLIASKGLTDTVCWAGGLNEEELLWCYNECRIFIMTSRIEACPNIAMEAMANGAVSVAADNPPLPEFFSDSAEYYEPGNGRSLAEAVLGLLSLDPVELTAISDRSLKRSGMFSWDLTAEKTMEVLMRVSKRQMGSSSQHR